MTIKTAVHVQIDYSDAISAKRNVLGCKVSLLEVLQHIKNYKRVRKEEMLLKSRLKSQLNDFVIEIGRVEQELPSLKEEGSIKLLKEAIRTEKMPAGMAKGEKTKSLSIDREISDIKRQLEMLE